MGLVSAFFLLPPDVQTRRKHRGRSGKRRSGRRRQRSGSKAQKPQDPAPAPAPATTKAPQAKTSSPAQPPPASPSPPPAAAAVSLLDRPLGDMTRTVIQGVEEETYNPAATVVGTTGGASAVCPDSSEYEPPLPVPPPGPPPPPNGPWPSEPPRSLWFCSESSAGSRLMTGSQREWVTRQNVRRIKRYERHHRSFLEYLCCVPPI